MTSLTNLAHINSLYVRYVATRTIQYRPKYSNTSGHNRHVPLPSWQIWRQRVKGRLIDSFGRSTHWTRPLLHIPRSALVLVELGSVDGKSYMENRQSAGVVDL